MTTRTSGSISKLGDSIETSEIADNQVTLAKLADFVDVGSIIAGGTAGSPTDIGAGTAGQILQTNGTASAPEWVDAGLQKLASGSFALQTSTTGYGTDKADIAINLGQLNNTDMILVRIAIFNDDASRTVSWSVQAQDTSSTGDIITESNGVTTDNRAFVNAQIWQDGTTNDLLVGSWDEMLTQADNTDRNGMGVLDTGDANVLATSWTLRLTAKFNLSATTAGKVQYWVYRML